MASENEFLLHALLMGIFVTFLYDLLRVIRRVIPHHSFLVSLEDLGFWIYCGAEVFLLMYHEGNGTLRWFAVFGAMLGMLLYRRLCSPFLVKYSSFLLGKLFGWLAWPLGKLSETVGKGISRVGTSCRRIKRRIERRVKNRLTYFLKMIKISLKR